MLFQNLLYPDLVADNGHGVLALFIHHHHHVPEGRADNFIQQNIRQSGGEGIGDNQNAHAKGNAGPQQNIAPLLTNKIAETHFQY